MIHQLDSKQWVRFSNDSRKQLGLNRLTTFIHSVAFRFEGAAWSYCESYPEVGRASDFVSFEPDVVSGQLAGRQLRLEPGQTVIPHAPIATSTSPKHSRKIQDGRTSRPHQSEAIWLDYFP
jgi:hypothetical protein